MAKGLKKPPSVASDGWRSAKWDEIVRGREFSQSDAPTIALLVQWYQVVEQCMADITANGEVQICYSNDVGDIKAIPDLSVMKMASAEIGQLNKQFGINDEGHLKYRRKGRSAKDMFKTKQVAAEMDRRDRAWLRDPSKPAPRTFAKQLERRPEGKGRGRLTRRTSSRQTGSVATTWPIEGWRPTRRTETGS